MYTRFLKETFGYDQFREKQLGIIRKVIEQNKDVCGIMFTGLGKSLCFQYIPTFLNKTALVISPLIALMNDQKKKLDNLGIPSCCLNSTTLKRGQVIQDIKDNMYRIVYLTPEYVTRHPEFIEDLANLDILCLITVDEAHIISNWGTNFRPEYRELHILRRLVPNIPIMALTATATPKVQEDIIKILELRKPYIVKTTFDRVNLSLTVRTKSNMENDLLHHLISGDPIIVYAKTHKSTESISKFAMKNGVKCDFYHGGMDTKDRESVHNKFINGEISCVVATIAFGMGIDIPIRKVIHYCISEDVESYYQEIGRAGRDGKPAECIMYYGNQDLAVTNFLISKVPDEDVKKQKLAMFRNMINYLTSTICRKKYILNYFGETLTNDCGKCDMCMRYNNDNSNSEIVDEDSAPYDITNDARNIFETIKNVKGKYGATTIINILIGKITDSKKDYLRELSTFGKYQKNTKNTKYLDTVIKLLTLNNYIKSSISSGFYSTIDITPSASNAITTRKSIIINVPINMLSSFETDTSKKECPQKKLPDTTTIIDLNDDEHLFESVDEVKKTLLKTNNNIVNQYLAGASLLIIGKNIGKTTRCVETAIIKEYRQNTNLDLSDFNISYTDYLDIINKIDVDKLGIIKKTTNLSYLQIKICIAHSKR